MNFALHLLSNVKRRQKKNSIEEFSAIGQNYFPDRQYPIDVLVFRMKIQLLTRVTIEERERSIA